MIRSGVYFGDCIVHCNETLTVDADKVQYLVTSNVQDPGYPDITAQESTAPDTWERLLKLADMKTLRTLPDRIGDPDANDAGGEWVEITHDRSTKRVEFSAGSAPPSIAGLTEALRELRERFSARYKK